MLPVTRIRAWRASPSDAPPIKINRGTIPDRATPAFLNDLHAVLLDLFDSWLILSARADLVPRIGGSPDLDRELLEILGMRAGSTEVRARAVVDDRLVAFTLPLVVRDAIAGRAPAAVLPAAKEAIAQWVAAWEEMKFGATERLTRIANATGTSVTSLTESPLMQLFGWRDSAPQPMPLVTNTGWADGPREYLSLLANGTTPPRTATTETLLLDILRHSLTRTAGAAAIKSAIGNLQDLKHPLLEGLLCDALDLCSVQARCVAHLTRHGSTPDTAPPDS